MITVLLYMLQVVTPAAIPVQQVTWTQNANATTAQAYIYKLYITQENGIKSTITLTNTLCGATPSGSQCSTALPAAGNVAIVTGNKSQLTATNPTNKMESTASAPYTGDQGCIFRTNLFKVGLETSAQSNKGQLGRLLDEFKQAKFKHVSTVQKGNQYVVTEQCVGFIVQ